MSFSIKIRKKMFLNFKKNTLKIEEIFKKLNLKAGYHNYAHILEEGNNDNGEILVYIPERLGRGIFINMSNIEKSGEIELTLPLPTTITEIRVLYKIVEEIKKQYKKIKIESSDYFWKNEEEFFFEQSNLINTSLEILKSAMKNNGLDTLTLVKFPYTLTSEQREVLAESLTLEKFEDFLHEVQVNDFYYAKPRIYSKNNSNKNVAYYILTEECVSVFPLEGKNTLATLYFDIDEYYISFYIASEDKLISNQFSYEKFIEIINLEERKKFDADHIIIPELSKKQIFDITNKLV